MRVMIDSNIALDMLRPNPDFADDAKHIFQLCWQDVIAPYMCVNSLTDIFYVLRKVQGTDKAKETIANLITAVTIVPLTEDDCRDALALPMNDFEDAIVAICARNIDADCIVSRDEMFRKVRVGIDVVTPGQLFALLR